MKINEKYILVFRINERMLTFTGRIISDDGVFVKFEDKFGKVLEYNRVNLISSEEIRQWVIFLWVLILKLNTFV